MTSSNEASHKDVLLTYLRAAREAVLWKTEGLSERDLRLPRTPTGTSLIGIVKHCLNVEAGYFGPTFGRRVPMADELIPFSAFETDPQVDWYASESETAAGLIDLYRRVGGYVDATIEELPLDSVGRVPWVAPGARGGHAPADHRPRDRGRRAPRRARRHPAGADRRSNGLNTRNSNVPDDIDWPAYVAKLTALAERY